MDQPGPRAYIKGLATRFAHFGWNVSLSSSLLPRRSLFTNPKPNLVQIDPELHESWFNRFLSLF